jgi:microsomal dipeptidase-like Zn-dependent dipeptidase
MNGAGEQRARDGSRVGSLGRYIFRRIVVATAAMFALAAAVFLVWGAEIVDRAANGVHEPPPYAASEKAHALLQRIFVADLHADTLLWDRDLARRSSHGHVDVARLIEAGQALQAFTIVTKVPLGLNLERNSASAPDLVTWLAVAEHWPPRTWTSLLERALLQAGKLEGIANRRDDFFVLRSREDLQRYVERREHSPAVTAGILGIEGAQALEGKLENLDVLFRAGIRMVGLTHFFDTELAGSAHGEAKAGLTPLGRAAIERMERLGILLDLAHASPAAIDEATALAKRPVVASHTGVKATCDNVRNLDDQRIRAIAATGGLIGIGFWETAICGADAAAIARSIRHVTELVGVEHVALGSDFDGAIRAPFDVTGVATIVDALLADGHDEASVEMIMGRNVRRLLAQALPSAEPAPR